MAKLYLEMKKFTDIHENQLKVNLKEPRDLSLKKVVTDAKEKHSNIQSKKKLSVPIYIKHQQQSALAAVAAISV